MDEYHEDECDLEVMCDQCGRSTDIFGEAYCKECTEKLRIENAKLQSELTELKEGIPIEKADKKKCYIHIIPFTDVVVVKWHEPMNAWAYFCNIEEEHITVEGVNVYPLPTQISETQEGS